MRTKYGCDPAFLGLEETKKRKKRQVVKLKAMRRWQQAGQNTC